MDLLFGNKDQLRNELQTVSMEISGKPLQEASLMERYGAVQTLLLRKVMPIWHQCTQEYAKEKEVYYFSIEILLGRLLGTNLIALNAEKVFAEVLEEFGIPFNLIEEMEQEPGLGNGGLGRLFACFLESLATLGLPGHGVSLLYKTGLMKQVIDPQSGKQIAEPDFWEVGEHYGLVPRAEEMVRIEIGGYVGNAEINGRMGYRVQDAHSLYVVPWVVPVMGYQKNVNNLFLLSTDVSKNLDNDVFDTYLQGNMSTNPFWKILVSLKLYPSAKQETGKWLRFVQEAVLALGGLRLILNRKIEALYPKANLAAIDLPQKQEMIRNVFSKLAFQINDTHPALLVPGVMQILLDEYGLDWEDAWAITQETISYTNHTVRPEALETWEINLFKKVLPRHFMIVEEINTAFRRDAKNLAPNNPAILGRIEPIDRLQRRVNMARLAIAGSHSVNGVAALHTTILKNDLFADFYALYPERFNNKTNGVTHRRFLLKANPELAALLDQYIGPQWRVDSQEFSKINELHLADNDAFVKAFQHVKSIKKQQLAAVVREFYGIELDPSTLFDSHVKRFHEYKRQLMQLLHILVLVKENEGRPKRTAYPRTFIFSGKAAEDYYEAKLTIQLAKYAYEKASELKAHAFHVVFVPNYNVTWAERIFAASDLSEQIPKAGQEASGTGLFKAVFNGALIVGTHDGANIEVADAVGDNHIFLFGTKVEDLNKPFNAADAVSAFPALEQVLAELRIHPEFNFFYRQLMEYGDPWAILRDFTEFYSLQEDLITPFYYKHPYEWTQKAIRALGASAQFSSDRTIREYAKEIWGIL